MMVSWNLHGYCYNNNILNMIYCYGHLMLYKWTYRTFEDTQKNEMIAYNFSSINTKTDVPSLHL
jgi:hypothetical protein